MSNQHVMEPPAGVPVKDCCALVHFATQQQPLIEAMQQTQN